MSVEDLGAAGLGGSDISDGSFRLASGVTVGEPTAVPNPIPPRPPAPPPPRMRLGSTPDGQVMSARPRAAHTEFGRLMHPAVPWLAGVLGLIAVGLVVALVGELHL